MYVYIDLYICLFIILTQMRTTIAEIISFLTFSLNGKWISCFIVIGDLLKSVLDRMVALTHFRKGIEKKSREETNRFHKNLVLVIPMDS